LRAPQCCQGLLPGDAPQGREVDAFDRDRLQDEAQNGAEAAAAKYRWTSSNVDHESAPASVSASPPAVQVRELSQVLVGSAR
jgi:hypothetical protein